MERASNIKLVAVAVLIVIFVTLVAWWVTGALNACRDPSKISMKFNEANGCLEFWVNRYQGVISAIMAAAVAFIVVRPAYWQLRELRRQTALGGLPVAHAAVVQADEELGFIRTIDERSKALADAAAFRSFENFDHNELQREKMSLNMAIMMINQAIGGIQQVGSRRSDGKDGEDLQAARSHFLGKWEQIHREIAIGLTCFDAALIVKAGETIANPNIAQRIEWMRRAQNALLSVHQIASEYEAFLTQIRSKRVLAAQRLLNEAAAS